MEGLLFKAILVAIFTWITFFDKYCTQFFTYRPIVVGPIVGLLMGNLQIGLEVGCIIELMFLGQVFVGTALPPEETFSTILASAFACISGSTEIALATALPLAILGQMGMYFRNMVLCVWTQNRLERAAAKGDRKGIWMNCLILPNLFNLVLFAVPVFLGLYFGADVVQAIINSIPKVIIDGLAVGGKMIGAVGLAILIKSINVKNIWQYFLVGFFFSSFLNINPIGITLIAVICVAMAFYNETRSEAASV
ncbi:PTS mannose/fructose/sorbose/N-acetylgalactosamine transporter subunit IIC [Clostridium polynesiense]|uniref:PTS mannose/fructose/sorbose/N-acetylgalactosamine transporter subunit IIC n=1 Tax=Clostridium polynesiense TaxID=1325933 RepID=UPI00058BE335|nr:PTS sugar transporter subunit IIC [Clostridium polynesiense]